MLWYSIAVIFTGGIIGYMIGVVSAKRYVKQENCNRLHVLPYEYRVICDGTDSVAVYTLISPENDTLGSFSNPMELETLILNDNL
jgi:hypothetical protein